MLRSLKTCLIWLLMLALPAQAVAAAAGSSCAMRHHASPAQPAVAHAWQAHPAADQPSPDHATTSGTTAKSDGATVTHKSGTCSVCANGCVGTAAIPAVADWTPAAANSFIAIVSPAPAFTAHIPTGLERPPRPGLI